MPQQISKAFQQASLAAYSLSDRLLIRLAEWAFYLLIKIIGSTLRFRTVGWENFEAIEKAGKLPIYAFWHDNIFAGTWFFRGRGIVVMTSKSRDGEYIARFIRRFGYGAVRGSSTRGGATALVELIRLMRNGSPAAFTVDGPKGPRHLAKPGAVHLAKKTGNPIMPFIVQSRKFWRIASWDRLQIPMPFTSCKIIIGSPIYVATNDEIEDIRSKLQASLDELTML